MHCREIVIYYNLAYLITGNDARTVSFAIFDGEDNLAGAKQVWTHSHEVLCYR